MKTLESESKPLQLQELHLDVDERPHVIPNEKAYRHTKATVEGTEHTLAGYRTHKIGEQDPIMQQLVEESRIAPLSKG